MSEATLSAPVRYRNALITLRATAPYYPRPLHRPLLMFTPCIASLMLLLPATVIATLAGPSAADIYAVLGVAPATVVVMYMVAKQARTGAHFAVVLCGSGGFGIFAPGIIANLLLSRWFDPAAYTWHVWMGLGFVCGLSGWSLTYAFCSYVFKNSEWFVRKGAESIGLKDQPPQ